jgi:prepilin-type N-terminal cleavage/methylation domain-containing protein/prepilin-type processing-associated H-X9-DG protein
MSQETGQRRAQQQAGVLTPSRERGEANVRFEQYAFALSPPERFSLNRQRREAGVLAPQISLSPPIRFFRVGVFICSFSFDARYNAPRGDNMKTRRAFTLIELLIVIAIIGLLAAILFPVFARARESARRASCQSNLKQIGLAIQQYSQDYDEKTLPAQLGSPAYAANSSSKALLWWGSWDGTTLRESEGLLFPYMKNSQIQACPSFTKALKTSIGLTGYAYNQSYLAPLSSDYSHTESISLSLIQATARTVQMADAASIVVDSSYNVVQPPALTGETYLTPPGDTNPPSYTGNFPNFHARHLETGNVLFCDGHVKAMKPIYRSGTFGSYNADDFRGLNLGDIDEDGVFTTNELFNGTGAP